MKPAANPKASRASQNGKNDMPHVFNMLEHVAAMMIPAGEESLICGIFNNNNLMRAISERTTRDGGWGKC